MMRLAWDALFALCVSLVVTRCAAPRVPAVLTHEPTVAHEPNVANATVLAVRLVPQGDALDRLRTDLAGALHRQAVPSADAVAEVILRTDGGRIVVLIRPAKTAPQPGERVVVAETGGPI